MQRYQGVLYVSGSFAFIDQHGDYSSRMARYNELLDHWDEFTCGAASTDLHVATFFQLGQDDTLYFTGYSGDVCAAGPSNVFAYDGTNFTVWEPFSAWNEDENVYVGIVFTFLDVWYMTGLFDDAITQQTYGILRFNGVAWEAVPGFEEPGPIKDILVHDSTLYVCGAFWEGPGIPGNMVAAFDGSTWNNMGGGLLYDLSGSDSGVAYDLTWWNGKVYASGQFHLAGGAPIEHIAAWDGTRWCGSGGDFEPNNSILDVEVWGDTLYVVGGFNSVNGQPASKVAQWIGGDFGAVCSEPVSVQEQAPAPGVLHVRPTGVAGQWWVSAPQGATLEVWNASGHLVARSLANSTSELVDVSGHGAGLFLIRCLSPKTAALIARVVVE